MKHPDITCNFLGRLGNNMFQVAAMIGYCDKYKVSTYGVPRNYHHRNIYHFNLPMYRGLASRLPLYDDTKEDGFVYRELPQFSKPTCLHGFFQSEKYFKHAEDMIKWTFPLKIDLSDYVAIHVRRGDYVEMDGNFLPTTIEDIEKVFLYFMGVGLVKFYIFSDDPEWCVNNIQPLVRKYEVLIKYSLASSWFEDMSAMASCQAVVVSRSSFSWWAAWLNPRPDKIVVALTPWFGPLNGLVNKTKDIIPENWTQL